MQQLLLFHIGRVAGGSSAFQADRRSFMECSPKALTCHERASPAAFCGCAAAPSSCWSDSRHTELRPYNGTHHAAIQRKALVAAHPEVELREGPGRGHTSAASCCCASLVARMTWPPLPPARGTIDLAWSRRSASSWKLGTSRVLCRQQYGRIGQQDLVHVPLCWSYRADPGALGSKDDAVRTSWRGSCSCPAAGAAAAEAVLSAGAAAG